MKAIHHFGPVIHEYAHLRYAIGGSITTRRFDIYNSVHGLCVRTANFVKIQQQVEEKMIMFRNRLDKLYRHRAKLAKKQGISCYRLYDQDLPEFPLCIEFYSNKLYVAEYKRRHGMDEAAHDHWMEQSMGVISDTLGVSRDNIFLKLRQRKPGRLGQYQKFGAEQHEFEVEESGLKFIVNLSDYLDTGLFLDHRLLQNIQIHEPFYFRQVRRSDCQT